MATIARRINTKPEMKPVIVAGVAKSMALARAKLFELELLVSKAKPDVSLTSCPLALKAVVCNDASKEPAANFSRRLLAL